MYRIMFVCLGNICRSPMAESVCKDMLEKEGRAHRFVVQSSATSDEEIGNPVYPPVASLLRGKGIDCSKKRAVQLTAADGDIYDVIVCMDDSNVRNAKRILGEKNSYKCVKLMSYVGSSADVSDPWYTRDFQTCYNDVCRGVRALLDSVKE